MIKIKLENIFFSESALLRMIQQDMSIKTAYKLDKLLNALQKEMEFIETNRIKLVEKYKDENSTAVAPENVNLFNKEFKDLLEIEIELNAEPFNMKELESVTLNYQEYKNIQPFIADMEI